MFCVFEPIYLPVASLELLMCLAARRSQVSGDVCIHQNNIKHRINGNAKAIMLYHRSYRPQNGKNVILYLK